MHEPLRVFIGYDPVESVAYHTLCHSIITQASVPVTITPVMSKQIDVFTRERDPKQSNDFSFSRFLVPYLSGYSGWALFMDCDMLLRCDIKELFDLKDYTMAVMVVKHDYTPKGAIKYLGNIQYKYDKKNWSSVMLFNCNHCHTRRLTPDYVNKATGLDLHQMKWTEDDRIGVLPKEWNWLVGEYSASPSAKNIHFTIGGAWFDEYKDCDYAEEWRQAARDMNHSDQLFIPKVKVSGR